MREGYVTEAVGKCNEEVIIIVMGDEYEGVIAARDLKSVRVLYFED